MKRLVCCAFFLSLFFAMFTASAAVDPVAAVVKLRKSCAENSATLDNCFTNLADLTNWMAGTRKPNATSPLRVEIGPGTFSGSGNPASLYLICNPGGNYTGFTSFAGAGTKQTIIKGNSYNDPVAVQDCTDLSFSDLSINSDLYGGVLWDGGGKSSWSNIEVNAVARAWYEDVCGSTKGSHYWFGSKLTATPAFTLAATYRATCDESWFFGSEVTVSVPAGVNAGGGGAVLAEGNGEIHVYGSVLRAFIDGTVGASFAVARAAPAGIASSGGTIHIHGTGMDAISQTGKNVVALYASSSGFIHANEAAYNLSTTGTITRIQNQGGHVHAPYLWQNHPDAPVITSDNGADIAVVTNTADGQPHLVIYSSNCTSKWFDTVTQACR